MRQFSTPLLFALAAPLFGGDGPFFITYTHRMEEPGNFEIGNRSITGKPNDGNRFFGSATEFEYGLKPWWTTAVYLEGQVTRNDSTVFTGYRSENRFRVLPREHWINPVLYVEFANINGANRSLLEVVGHDGESDLAGRNAADGRRTRNAVFSTIRAHGHPHHGWSEDDGISSRSLDGSR